MTKIIPGTKKELARGFADVNTPSKRITETLMTLSTKREVVLQEIAKRQQSLKADKLTSGQRKDHAMHLDRLYFVLREIREKCKRVANVDSHLVYRMKPYLNEQEWHRVCALAKADAKAALEQIPWITDDESDMAANKQMGDAIRLRAVPDKQSQVWA